MQDYQKRVVLNLLAYAVQKNLSAERLCALSGIEQSALVKETGVSLTAKQVADLWLNAVHLSHDPLFGLHFGESLQVAALGVVGELIRHSRTIGEALTHAASFAHLITDLFEIEVTRSGQAFSIHLVSNQNHPNESLPVLRQMMDFFMAFVLHEVDGLVLEKICPTVVTLPFEETNRNEYERVFRGSAIQNSTDFKLKFVGRYWGDPILTADYELQGIFLRKVSAMNDAFQKKQGFSDRITRFLLTNAYLGVPTLDAIAANLNVSSRSLQRKLQEEGVTYQQLTDSIRKSLALHYLESGRYPVKEVSYILGYNELSAFNRAFRRWTGTTPVSYQKRH